MMWNLIRTHPRSTAWIVVVWMVTVLLLLAIGPVVHL
jgi:hypothetical protein